MFSFQCTGACEDTHGFDNGQGKDSNSGKKCADYYSQGWCNDGAVTPEGEKFTGKKYNYPERSCCVCGKKKAIPDEKPDGGMLDSMSSMFGSKEKKPLTCSSDGELKTQDWEKEKVTCFPCYPLSLCGGEAAFC